MTPLHPDRRTAEGVAPAGRAPGDASEHDSHERAALRRGRHRAPNPSIAGLSACRARVARTVSARTTEVARTARAAATRTARVAARTAGTRAAPDAAGPPVAEAARPGAVPAPAVLAVEEPPAAAPVAPADDAGDPPVDPAALPSDGRRQSSLRSRSAPYLAAAVVGAIGITLPYAGDPTAVAETAAVHESISVAEALDVEAEEAEPILGAETTDRLGELVASRAERDEQELHAALVQAKADTKARQEAERAAAAAAEAARPEAVLPVRGARLTSGFGARWGTLHAGIDLAAPMRTPEMAAMDGVVLEAGPASGFGLAVYIQHRNGDVTVYGHMDEIRVTAGQVVQVGDTIALLGNRGQSTGPHLHFEVHQGGLDGTKIDPVPWLRERGVRI